MTEGEGKRVIIIGCGRIGAHVAQRLADDGHRVCVIDSDPASMERLGPAFPGSRVVGQGFDEEVLRRAQVDGADGVAVLTNVDATNFMVARAVTALFGVRKLTVRVNDPEFHDFAEEMGWDTVELPDLVLRGVRDLLAAGGGQG